MLIILCKLGRILPIVAKLLEIKNEKYTGSRKISREERERRGKNEEINLSNVKIVESKQIVEIMRLDHFKKGFSFSEL